MIVKEEELRLLLSYGTKFREIPLLNIKEIKASIKRNLRTFCNSWLRHFKKRKMDRLRNWEDKALGYIYNRLDLIGFLV